MSDKEVTKPQAAAEQRIPDLVRIGEIPSEYGQTVHTDIIDPVTSSQTSARFTLNRVAGFFIPILKSLSVLILSLTHRPSIHYK